MAGPNQGLDAGALYSVYIDYIRHENELLNHRTTWFLAIETVLVAAAGYLLLSYFESFVSHVAGRPDSDPEHIAEFVLAALVVCAFGLIAARGAACSIEAALEAQDSLVEHWKSLDLPAEEVAKLPDLMGGKSPKAKADGGRLAHLLVKSAYRFWVLCLLVLGGALASIAIRMFA